MPAIAVNYQLSSHKRESHPGDAKSQLWIGAIAIPCVLVLFSFVLLMGYIWKHRHEPPYEQTKQNSYTGVVKPELDGRDTRVEAGHGVPAAKEVDAGLKAEMLGCVMAPQLLDSKVVAVEMSVDCGVHELCAGSIQLDDSATSIDIGSTESRAGPPSPDGALQSARAHRCV